MAFWGLPETLAGTPRGRTFRALEIGAWRTGGGETASNGYYRENRPGRPAIPKPPPDVRRARAAGRTGPVPTSRFERSRNDHLARGRPHRVRLRPVPRRGGPGGGRPVGGDEPGRVEPARARLARRDEGPPVRR